MAKSTPKTVMETDIFSFRPTEVLKLAIAKEVDETGDSKGTVVLRRLMTAYGLSEDVPAAPVPSVIDKLRAEMEAAIAPILAELETVKKL